LTEVTVLRSLRFFAVASVLLVLPNQYDNSKPIMATDKQSDVRLTLDKFFATAAQQDWDKIGEMLTEDFQIFTDEVTILNKAEYIKVLKQDDIRFTQMRLRDLRLEVSQGGQIAWCRYHGFFHTSSGRKSTYVETAETVVFRNEFGTWKIVQAHASIKERPWRYGPDGDSVQFDESGIILPSRN
jgi:ketosteroid isomerase-like protein